MRIFSALMLFALLVAAAPDIHAGEAVVYAVSHYDRPGYEGLCGSTDIFTISASGGLPVRVFSDAAIHGFKLPCLDGIDNGRNLMAVNPRTGVLYARISIFDASQGVQAAIVEISLDGSNRYRKLTGTRNAAELTNLFVTSAGDGIGTWDGSKFSFFDSKTGAHLSDSSTHALSDLLDYKCSIGNILAVGWLDRDQKVFVTLGDPAEEDLEDPETKLLGTWVTQKDGSNLKRIGPPPDVFTIPGYRFDEVGEFNILLLGQTSGGDFVFMADMQRAADASGPVDFLAISHPGSKTGSSTAKQAGSDTVTIVPINSHVAGTGVSLSPNGDFIAYASTPADAQNEPNPETDVLVKPLTDAPASNLTTYVPEVYHVGGHTRLWVMGWLEN